MADDLGTAKERFTRLLNEPCSSESGRDQRLRAWPTREDKRRDDLADGDLDCLGRMDKDVSVEDDGVNPAEQSWNLCSHSYCITSLF